MSFLSYVLPVPGAKPCVAVDLPIIGCDIHLCIPPWPPAPEPHLVIWTVGPSTAPGCSKAAANVLSPMGQMVARGHDAAFVLGHLQVNALLPIIWLGSASKTEFGVGSVRLHDGPVAVGESFIKGMQLHCNDVPPLPLPLGVNISILNQKVRAGLTWADIIASVVATVIDMAISYLINKLMGAAAKKAMLGLLRAISRPLANLIVSIIGKSGVKLAINIVNTIFNFLFGGPTGGSFPYGPFGLGGGTFYDPIFDLVRGVFA